MIREIRILTCFLLGKSPERIKPVVNVSFPSSMAVTDLVEPKEEGKGNRSQIKCFKAFYNIFIGPVLL